MASTSCSAQGFVVALTLAALMPACARGARTSADGSVFSRDGEPSSIEPDGGADDAEVARDAGAPIDGGPVGGVDGAPADADTEPRPTCITDDILHLGVASEAGGQRIGLSANGRFVMFESPLPLDPNDTDGLWDVYVLDRVFGGVVRVTLDHINAVMDTYGLQLSDDGRFVLFAADAQIVPEDRWGDLDVHLRDLVTGDVELVSGRHAEVTGLAAMSADAQIVVWTASTDDRAGLDANGSGVDVFVLDRARGIVSRANVDASGAQSDGDAMGATVSADGSVVAFFSNSTALVGHPVPRGDWYPFVYDRVSGAIEMVATSSIGIPSNGPCGYELSLSGDGRRVAFACRASNLVPASTLEQQLFVKDRTSEAITAVIPLDAMPYFHRAPSLSRDGRFIAFASAWCGLGGDVTCSCVAGTHYVRDLATSDVFRLGYEDRCVPSRVFLTSPAPAQWSADGRFAGFSSALRLTPSSDDDVADLFVYSFCRL